ncbi:MAG: TRAP transporter small permease [Rhodobacteraceae bacterium]|nr:MAG: TRAP transporter small permease [Paracoccaceae bacterium]
MSILVRFSAGLCRVLALIGGAAVVLMMLHVTLDVVLLNLFRISMNTAPEIVARYYMVAVAFLPLGWLTMRNQMISVELLDFMVPKPVLRVSDFLIALIGVGVYGLLTHATWLRALREMRSRSFVDLVSVQLPVWPSHFLVPAGFALATLACAMTAVVLLSRDARAELDRLLDGDDQ